MAVPRSRNSHSKQNSKRAHLSLSGGRSKLCPVCGSCYIRSHSAWCNKCDKKKRSKQSAN